MSDFIISIRFLTCTLLMCLCRVLLDRAHSNYDSDFRQLDVDMLSSPEHTSINLFANTSEMNTSDKCFSKDLSQILVNIKSCRWRHFRPRTTSLHDSDNVDFSCRTFHKGITRTGTAQPGTQTCSTSTSSKSSSGSAHFGMWPPIHSTQSFPWKHACHCGAMFATLQISSTERIYFSFFVSQLCGNIQLLVLLEHLLQLSFVACFIYTFKNECICHSEKYVVTGHPFSLY